MIHFTKAHAYGNDFLYVDRFAVAGVDLPELARQMCHRTTGIGADGLIAYSRTTVGASMVLTNSDGSRAEVSGNGVRALGACLGLMTFSTWRGARGLYVVDLFVLPEARGRRLGESLLRLSAERAASRGAQFIKLEVDETNTGAERFYARLGFTKKTEDRLHILEQDRFRTFAALGGTT